MERYTENASKAQGARAKAQLKAVEDEPATLQALLNIALNQILVAGGEAPVRFRTMKYEFSRQGEKVQAALPAGSDVKKGALDFFGVNAAIKSAQESNRSRASGGTTTTVPADTSGLTTTTSSP